MEKQESYDAAIEFYSKAADLFATEDSTSEANKCRLKVAEHAAKNGKYQQAVEVRFVKLAFFLSVNLDF